MGNPSCYKPVRHRMTRRSRKHDYTAPGFYLITMTKSDDIPAFCKVTGDPRIKPGEPGAPAVTLSQIGGIVWEEIQLISSRNRSIEIDSCVVMPDHIHFIVNVKEYLERHLGFEMAVFKKNCTQRIFRHLSGNAAASPGRDRSAFDKSYNDSIALRIGQLEAMRKYTMDNPRRRAILRDYPDFFTRHITVNTPFQTFACFGNPFLLQIPDKVPVKVRSFWTDEEFEKQKEEWLRTVYNGAILISPFYSPREKIVKEEALAMGGSVIIMRNVGFPERFKPSGREFELCSDGRLLLMAEVDAPLHKPKIERAEALRLNAHCEALAAIPYENLLFSIRHKTYR